MFRKINDSQILFNIIKSTTYIFISAVFILFLHNHILIQSVNNNNAHEEIKDTFTNNYIVSAKDDIIKPIVSPEQAQLIQRPQIE
jgi:hypothetical protein